MKLFYTLGVEVYVLAVRIAALWNPKAKLWVAGRKHVWNKIEGFNNEGNVIWFHCASLGEFEQGRPVMEKLKASQKCQIVLTFFSPSGYEIKKDYPGADLIVYLPKDSKKNAARFLNAIEPSSIYIVKYEFWANYIEQAHAQKIKLYSISAIFRPSQVFFKFYGGYMRSVLKKFTTIFVQNQASKDLLDGIGVSSVICGDTRYDRVYENSLKVKQYDNVAQFVEGKKVLVCGSIWSEDLEVLKSRLNQMTDWKIIIAPHEIKSSFIHEIIDALKLSTVQYSVLSEQKMDANVLIIDNIGMLMNLYQYADLAYVGGAFRTGLHNILEPAAFGVPVVFGPKHDKFPEAAAFIKSDIGFSVEDENDVMRVFDQLENTDSRNRVNEFMAQRRGATAIILNAID